MNTSTWIKITFLAAAILLSAGTLTAQESARKPPQSALELPYEFRTNVLGRVQSLYNWITGNYPQTLRAADREKEEADPEELTLAGFRQKYYAVLALVRNPKHLDDAAEATGFRQENFVNFCKEAEKFGKLAAAVSQASENPEAYAARMKEFTEAAKEFGKKNDRKKWHRLNSEEKKKLAAKNKKRRAAEWYQQQKEKKQKQGDKK